MPRSDWVHCPTRFCHKAASRTAGFTSGETKSLSDCYPLSQSQTNKHQKSLVPTGSNSCKGIQGSGRSHLKLRDDVTGQEPHQGAGPGLRALTSPRAPAPPRPPRAPLRAHHGSVVLLQSRCPDHLAQEPPVPESVLLPLKTLIQ